MQNEAEAQPESDVSLADPIRSGAETDTSSAPEFGPSEILSLDIFSHPVEPLLAIFAVAGAFIFVVGLMMNLATELTEEGSWFFYAVGVPVPIATSGIVGFPMLGIWMFFTALVFIFVKARTLYWVTLFPAMIFIPIICLVIRHFLNPVLGQSEFAHGAADLLLESLPGIVVPAAALVFLKVDFKKHWPWFTTIVAPAVIHLLIQVIARPNSTGKIPELLRYERLQIHFVTGIVFISIALVIAVAVPIVLGVLRKNQCGKPLVIGSSLLAGGAVMMVLTCITHAANFAH